MPTDVDVAIFGGGIAGLWLLDTLVRQGVRPLLLEAGALGSGQTIASQGILHSGLKYTLQGLLTPAAQHAAAMTDIWRQCLTGEASGPDLRSVCLRSPHCYLWRTNSLQSRLGMLGARFGLKVAPVNLSSAERPTVLKNCPGSVARLDEQVLSPASLIETLAAPHRQRILKYNARIPLQVEWDTAGNVCSVRLTDDSGTRKLDLRPRFLVLTAGAGNGMLRQQLGLEENRMQRRPLQMVMLRGNLPVLNGHCIDGAKTRVTMTSQVETSGQVVWQVGGQLAEEGARLDSADLLRRAQTELLQTVPGVDLQNVEWGTYRVDRAEGATTDGARPDTVQVISEANVFTAWPTKLVLAPELARQVIARLPKSVIGQTRPDSLEESLHNWPRPAVADFPWEAYQDWVRLPLPSRRHVA